MIHNLYIYIDIIIWFQVGSKKCLPQTTFSKKPFQPRPTWLQNFGVAFMDPKAGVSPVTGLTIGWMMKMMWHFWQLEMLLEKKCILKYINFEIFSLNSPLFAKRKVPPRLIRQRSQQKNVEFFQAPEVYHLKPQNWSWKTEPFMIPKKINTSPKNYDEKSVEKISWTGDVWSCGVVLFVMLTGMGRVFGVPGTLSPIGVSENSGTSKSSILIGCSIINHPFGDTPYSRKHPHSHGSGKWVP